MDTLRNHIIKSSDARLSDLWIEGESWENTGIMPENAEMRDIMRQFDQFGGAAHIWFMTIMSELRREVAMRAVWQLQLRDGNNDWAHTIYDGAR